MTISYILYLGTQRGNLRGLHRKILPSLQFIPKAVTREELACALLNGLTTPTATLVVMTDKSLALVP